jgi:uncharacterized membrane protein YkoI
MIKHFARGMALLALLALAASVAAGAAEKKEGARAAWQGSIPVSGKHSEAELQSMTRISQAEAKKTALAAVEGKDKDKKAGEVELEVENGYLIYSVDVKVKKRRGVEEILVDAGTGKVLAHEHESAQSEAKEKKGEKGAKEKRGG